MKGPRAQALRNLQGDDEIILAAAALDPTPQYKYLKWILTRLYRDVNAIQDVMLTAEGRPVTLKALLVEFEAVKHRLQVHMRDIFNYHTVAALEDVLALQRKDRVKASRMICKQWNVEELMKRTQVMEYEGLSVHEARCVEDVVLLTGSDDVFDLRGDKLYQDLAKRGQVYVFNTGYGPLVGSLPREEGERGDLHDSTGERAMFEDALAVHCDLDWHSAPEIIELMCKIDPALPFDEEMEEVGPFVAALNQFPLVLHEDREIPDEIRDDLLESGLLNARTLELIAELA
jgi:hypothetical protein